MLPSEYSLYVNYWFFAFEFLYNTFLGLKSTHCQKVLCVFMNFRITLYDLFVCHLQNFLVDIKGPGLAFLPVLAFEGGTRRNIPRFEVCTSLRSCLYVNCKDKVVHSLV